MNLWGHKIPTISGGIEVAYPIYTAKPKMAVIVFIHRPKIEFIGNKPLCFCNKLKGFRFILLIFVEINSRIKTDNTFCAAYPVVAVAALFYEITNAVGQAVGHGYIAEF